LSQTDRPDAEKPGVSPADGGQRLDRWLWFIRAIKSRTQAAALVTDGKVRVNRVRIDKPSQAVRPGDVITVTVRGKVRVVRVLAPGTRRGPPAEARTLFEEVVAASHTPTDPTSADVAAAADERSKPAFDAPSPRRESGNSRPTKRDRRQTDRLRSR
jgi:ribosome-associated heat shock protein Hsp15